MLGYRNRRTRSIWQLLAPLLAAGVLMAACAEDADEPVGEAEEPEDEADLETEDDDDVAESAAIGTHDTGSSYHAVGTGLASLISDHTSIRATVQPHAGPNAWMPDLQSGALEFGIVSSIDAEWAYTGGPGYDEPVEEIRTVLDGAPLHFLSMATLEDSGVEQLSDLEGQDVATDFGGNLILNRITEANLASVDLTMDDVNPVPIPDFISGIDALRNREVTATTAGTIGVPALDDVDAAVGVRGLAFGDLTPEDIQDGVPDDMQATLDEYVPGATLEVAEAGQGVLDEDTVIIEYMVQLASSTLVSDATVYALMEAIWEHHEQLHESHPTLGRWEPDTMATTEPRAPYHQGAIDFYDEEGVWTDEHQEAQDALLGG